MVYIIDTCQFVSGLPCLQSEASLAWSISLDHSSCILLCLSRSLLFPVSVPWIRPFLSHCFVSIAASLSCSRTAFSLIFLHPSRYSALNAIFSLPTSISAHSFSLSCLSPPSCCTHTARDRQHVLLVPAACARAIPTSRQPANWRLPRAASCGQSAVENISWSRLNISFFLSLSLIALALLLSCSLARALFVSPNRSRWLSFSHHTFLSTSIHCLPQPLLQQYQGGRVRDAALRD